MDQADAFYDKVSELVDDSNDLGKAVVDAWDDDEDNPPDWALDDETKAILVNAGRIEPEMEEPDMEEAAKPDYIDLDGDGDKEESMKKAAKDKKEKEKKESFDPRAEQSREDQAYEEIMNAYEKGGEEAMCKVIGCSIEELDSEIDEVGREKGLHPDDDRDEIIQIYVEDLVDNADWKDHGEYDVDPADMEMEEDLNRMRKLAGLEEMSLDDPITRQQFMKFGKIRQKFVSIFGKDAVDIIDNEWKEQKRSKKDKADPDETFAMAYQKAKSQKPKQLSMDI